jgi:protein TonB
LVTGSSESFAGGYSSAKGTEKKPVAEAPPPAPSKARAAAPARRDWSCSWPPDAEESDLKDAYVSIAVAVDENGSATQVDILKTPGASFADAAKSCALSERYEVALDKDGHPLASKTPHFVVHFFR